MRLSYNPVSSIILTQVQLVAQERIGLQNGFLIAAQLPEKYIADAIEIQTAVEQAIRESEQNGISSSGKDATPWLLARVAELTNGKSLRNSSCFQFVMPFFSLADGE